MSTTGGAGGFRSISRANCGEEIGEGLTRLHLTAVVAMMSGRW